MTNGLVFRIVVLFLMATCLAVAVQSPGLSQPLQSDDDGLNQSRWKRAAGKPGFFRTLFSVIYEQYQDTKNTFSSVNQMINDNFLPDNPPITPPTTTVKPVGNGTTTAAPYKITRAEFLKIIRRNLRGLRRLYDIELQDALKQSEKNYAEFRRNASLEISKFL